MKIKILDYVVFAGLAIALIAGNSLAAETPSSFYKGKQVSLIVSFNPGGGGDAYARLAGRHIGSHIPGNPSVVVKNMPGAGGLTAANYLFNRAPKDGTEIGLFPGNIGSLQIFGKKNVKYDMRKFNWIGSLTAETPLCVSSSKGPFEKFDDVFSKQMVIGTAGTATRDSPLTLNNVLGTKFKLVKGYKGSSGLRLATDRGEIDGFCGVGYDSLKTKGIANGQLKVLLQLSGKKHAELPQIPTVFSYVKTDEDRQVVNLIFVWSDIARPIAAPPGTPNENVKILRNGFDIMVKDSRFLKDAESISLGIEASTGNEVSQVIQEVFRTPKQTIQKAKKALQAN